MQNTIKTGDSFKDSLMRTDIKDFVFCSTAPFYPLHDLTRFTDSAENIHFLLSKFYAGLVS